MPQPNVQLPQLLPQPPIAQVDADAAEAVWGQQAAEKLLDAEPIPGYRLNIDAVGGIPIRRGRR